MKKTIVRLFFYILVLAVTVSSAWILNPTNNIGRDALLDYSGIGDGGKLTVSSTEVEMQVFMQINDKWRNLGSSKDTVFETRPKFSSIVPNTIIPFRIRFYNKSNNVATMRITLSDITCHKILTDKNVVYVSTISGTEYSQYAGIVTPPSYTYQALSTGKLISVIENNSGEQLVTYDLVLYDELEIPPTNEKYVEIEGYFYFDAESMTNDCAGKTFEIGSFQAAHS